MSLTRKQKRNLQKLRSQTEELLNEQREVLGHAGQVAQEAGRQAKYLGNEYVMPRVADATASVRPYVDRGVSATRRVVDQARAAAAPALAAALTSAVRGLERSENRELAKQLQHFGVQRGIVTPTKKKHTLGTVLAISVGVAAAGFVAYSVWQAFREDDDLWSSPEG